MTENKTTTENKEAIYKVIKILNDNGLQIIEINGEYFSVIRFSPADKSTPYHILSAKHITSIVRQKINIGLQGHSIQGVMQEIEMLPTREVQYSEGVQWVWYIR